MATYTKVFKSSSTVINPSDLSNYYAGGDIRNELLSGGQAFSGVDIPKLNKVASPNNNINLLEGNFLTYLGAGIVDIQNIINGYTLLGNSLNDNVNNVSVVRVTINVVDMKSGVTIYSREGEHEINGDDIFGNVATAGDLRDLANAWAMRTSLSSLTNPIGISLTVFNLVTNERATIKSTLGGLLVGTVTSQINGLITQTVAKTIGITALTPTVMLGAAVLNMVLGELEEMALGLDNHFGFGGDLKGFDTSGQDIGFGYIEGVNTSIHAQYNPAMTFSTGLTNMFSSVTDMLGITYDGGISIDDSQTAEERADDALGDYYGDTNISDGDYEGNNEYGGLESATEQTQTESEQRGQDFGDFSTEDDDSNDSDGKVVCTAMNQKYGFGSFRNKIWIAYARRNLTKYHEVGYHYIFKPLVRKAYYEDKRWLQKVLEHIARHRSIDLRAEMTHGKRDIIGRMERSILEPLCYVVGRIVVA